MKPEWVHREQPLVATAVAATGAAARALARSVLARGTSGLRAVAGVEVLVVSGPADALPWVDGVVYLAQDPDAPRLYLPTTRAFSLHPALVERALRRLPGLAHGPIAALPSGAVISLEALGAIDPAQLEAWSR